AAAVSAAVSGDEPAGAAVGGAAAAVAGLGVAGGAGADAEARRAEMSSSALAMAPIRAPTGALPPAGTRILRRTPTPRASISMLALSVSISARTSPTLTGSPSFLLH